MDGAVNMQNTRGRRETRQGAVPPTQQMLYEDFKPSSDWTHDSNAHILLLDLPGFKKGDVKLQVDNTGKVTVSGERRVGDNKYRRFNVVFDAPKDSNVEKVSGKFEYGLLFVIMPKKEADNSKVAEPENREGLIDTMQKEEENQRDNKSEPKTELIKESENAKHEPDQPKAQVKEDEKPRDRSEPKREESSIHKADPIKKIDVRVGRSETEGKERTERGKEEEVRDHKRKTEIEKLKEEILEDDFLERVVEMVRKNKVVIVTTVVAFTFGLFVARKVRLSG